MGSYSPAEHGQRKSIKDTLREAELDHHLDCPNADFALRSAAALLDLILFSLAANGITQLTDALRTVVPVFLPEATESALPTLHLVTLYGAWMLKTALWYLYFVWAVVRFGASPAKLILGMRVLDAESGHNLTMLQSFVREVAAKPFSVLILLGPLFGLWREDRRWLHDLATRSAVKKLRGGP